MKVAVVHNQALGTREAGIAFVTGAATGFAQAGAETDLLLPGPADDADRHLAALNVPAPAPFSLPFLPAVQLNLGPFRPSWSGPFRNAVLRQLNEGGYDIAVVRDLKLADFLLAGGLKPKLVFELHNLYSLGQDDPNADRLFPAEKLERHRQREGLEKSVLERVDGAIVLTAGLKDLLEPHYGLARRVGVGGSALHPMTPPTKTEGRNDIAYIGSLDPHKGVGTIVRALPNLPEKVRLLLIGHGRHHEALLKLAVHLGVADRLELAGWFSPAELPARLATCFAAVVPLADAFYNRYVTSPMKLFEYARAGVVPVVPHLPVFDELFATGGGVFVADHTPAAYTEALRMLHADAGFREGKETELAEFAATHTWQTRGAALLEFFGGLEARVP